MLISERAGLGLRLSDECDECDECLEEDLEEGLEEPFEDDLAELFEDDWGRSLEDDFGDSLHVFEFVLAEVEDSDMSPGKDWDALV